jgi:hypothetical protein
MAMTQDSIAVGVFQDWEWPRYSFPMVKSFTLTIALH